MRVLFSILMVLSALTGLAAGSQATEFTVSSMTFPLASDYISIKSNADLVDYRGSGTADDPYVIEGISLDDHVGNGIVIENTDAYVLIKNCTLENLNGGYDALLPLAMNLEGVRNIRIEDCRVSDSDIRVSRAENVRFKDIDGSALMFDGVLNGVIEECSIDHIIVEATGIFALSPGSLPLNVTKVPSQNCLIKDCKAGTEIVLFDCKGCIAENCIIEGHTKGTGLWIFDSGNVTVHNVTVVDGILGLHRTSPLDPMSIVFDGLKLVKSDIFLAGLNSEDSIDLFNSTVDGKEISYFKDKVGLKLEDVELGYLWLTSCSGSCVKGVKTVGISAINSSDLAVEDSVIQGGGIFLAFSSDCLISNNTLINSSARAGGITLSFGCHNDTLRDNVVTRVKKNGSDYLTSLGIDTTLSEGDHAIFGNVVMNAGIGLDVGRNNTIIGNTIANNAIGLRASDDHNEIAQNNFVYNGIDAQQRSTIAWKDVSFVNNSWDGNFWTSYRGEDEDGNGVSDTLHVVPAGWPSSGEAEAVVEERVVDNAPKMEPIQQRWDIE
jgi:parallel beta-helix repeat protein